MRPGLRICGSALGVTLPSLCLVSLSHPRWQCFYWYKTLRNFVGLLCNSWRPGHRRRGSSTDHSCITRLYPWLLWRRSVVSVSHTPNLFVHSPLATCLPVSRAHRLRLFQVIKCWLLFINNYPLNLSLFSHRLLQTPRRKQYAPSVLCLETSAERPSSLLLPPLQSRIQPRPLTLITRIAFPQRSNNMVVISF